MTRLAYELTQFVNDLRTITAEMRDPRASRVRVPLGSGEHGSFQPHTVFGRCDEWRCRVEVGWYS